MLKIISWIVAIIFAYMLFAYLHNKFSKVIRHFLFKRKRKRIKDLYLPPQNKLLPKWYKKLINRFFHKKELELPDIKKDMEARKQVVEKIYRDEPQEKQEYVQQRFKILDLIRPIGRWTKMVFDRDYEELMAMLRFNDPTKGYWVNRVDAQKKVLNKQKHTTRRQR